MSVKSYPDNYLLFIVTLRVVGSQYLFQFIDVAEHGLVLGHIAQIMPRIPNSMNKVQVVSFPNTCSAMISEKQERQMTRRNKLGLTIWPCRRRPRKRVYWRCTDRSWLAWSRRRTWAWARDLAGTHLVEQQRLKMQSVPRTKHKIKYTQSWPCSA